MIDQNNNKIIDELINAIVDGDEESSKKLAEKAILAGIDPIEIVKKGIQKAASIVGDKFQRFEIFLSQLILSANAMKAVMDTILPRIKSSEMKESILGKVVIATVQGDIHDIGKNLVSAFLSVNGFEVHDLGVDIQAKKIVEEAENFKADIIAMSALLTNSLPFIADTIKLLEDSNLRDKYFLIVGGGSVTPEFVLSVKADGYARYGDNAPKLCKKLIESKSIPPLSEPVIME
ncbi:MAG: cobalamin-dependent protein [Candidatus Bathyarchaeia archaeon]